MKEINWQVRIKNKNFWLTLIPAIAILVQVVLVPFGYEIDLTELTGQLLAIVNAIFAVLMIIGVVNDPVTVGFKDSERAMYYKQPRGK
jgi:phi LC3 family holin